jgi:hypothetical protein
MPESLVPANESTTEESDGKEGSPEEQYRQGNIDYHEYMDIKARCRVDAFYHTVLEVTGTDYTIPENRQPQPASLKTIGFVQ